MDRSDISNNTHTQPTNDYSYMCNESNISHSAQNAQAPFVLDLHTCPRVKIIRCTSLQLADTTTTTL